MIFFSFYKSGYVAGLEEKFRSRLPHQLPKLPSEKTALSSFSNILSGCTKHFIFVIKKTKIYNHEISFLVSLSQNRNLQRYRYRILVEYLGLHWILVKCLIKFKTVEILDSFIQSSIQSTHKSNIKPINDHSGLN